MKKKGLLPVLLALCLLIAGCGRTDIAKESITAATTSDSVLTNENGSETANPESLRDGRNFALTEEEMTQMTALERDERFADY